MHPWRGASGQGRSCVKLDRAITYASCDAQSFLPESEGLIVLAGAPPLQHHEGRDAPNPVLIAKPPGEHLRLVEVITYSCQITEGVECVTQVYMDVGGQLGRGPGLGQTTESHERLLQVRNCLAVGAPRHGPNPRLAEIGYRFLPQLPTQGVMGQPFRLLGDALG